MMTLAHDVQFAGLMAKRFSTAARINAAAAVRARVRPHAIRSGAEMTGYDPLDPATAAQPYSAYSRLHAGGRVHYNPKRSIWVLTHLDDVRAAARADSVLSSAEGVTLARFAAPILLTTDGERHSRMRRQVLPAFTRSALSSWRPTIDAMAASLVDDVLNDPGCDVVQRLAVPMPTRLIAKFLGVGDGDFNDFRRWSESAIQATDFAFTRRGIRTWPASFSGTRAIYRYFRRQLAAGEMKQPDTILGRLLTEKDAGTVTDDELFFFAFLLLLAGNETTTNLLGGMFDTFANHPEQFDLIRSDHSLIPMAVEELLRYLSPVQNLFRTARSDYPVGEVTIPAGARVQLSFAAANRDPRVFDDPDTFRIDRNPTEHIALGFGAHFCLGAQLARMEVQAVLRELVIRVSRVSAVGETSWSTNSSLRGPAHMRVQLASVMPTSVRGEE